MSLVAFACHASGSALELLAEQLAAAATNRSGGGDGDGGGGGMEAEALMDAVHKLLGELLFVLDVPYSADRTATTGCGGDGVPEDPDGGGGGRPGVLPLAAFLRQSAEAAGGAALVGRRVWVHIFTSPHSKGSYDNAVRPPNCYSGRLIEYDRETGSHRVEYDPDQGLEQWQVEGEEYGSVHVAACHVRLEPQEPGVAPGEPGGPLDVRERGRAAEAEAGRGLLGPFQDCIEEVPLDWQAWVHDLLRRRQDAPPAPASPLRVDGDAEGMEAVGATEVVRDGAAASEHMQESKAPDAAPAAAAAAAVPAVAAAKPAGADTSEADGGAAASAGAWADDAAGGEATEADEAATVEAAMEVEAAEAAAATVEAAAAEVAEVEAAEADEAATLEAAAAEVAEVEAAEAAAATVEAAAAEVAEAAAATVEAAAADVAEAEVAAAAAAAATVEAAAAEVEEAESGVARLAIEEPAAEGPQRGGTDTPGAGVVAVSTAAAAFEAGHAGAAVQETPPTPPLPPLSVTAESAVEAEAAGGLDGAGKAAEGPPLSRCRVPSPTLDAAPPLLSTPEAEAAAVGVAGPRPPSSPPAPRPSAEPLQPPQLQAPQPAFLPESQPPQPSQQTFHVEWEPLQQQPSHPELHPELHPAAGHVEEMEVEVDDTAAASGAMGTAQQGSNVTTSGPSGATSAAAAASPQMEQAPARVAAAGTDAQQAQAQVAPQPQPGLQAASQAQAALQPQPQAAPQPQPQAASQPQAEEEGMDLDVDLDVGAYLVSEGSLEGPGQAASASGPPSGPGLWDEARPMPPDELTRGQRQPGSQAPSPPAGSGLEYLGVADQQPHQQAAGQAQDNQQANQRQGSLAASPSAGKGEGEAVAEAAGESEGGAAEAAAAAVAATAPADTAAAVVSAEALVAAAAALVAAGGESGGCDLEGGEWGLWDDLDQPDRAAGAAEGKDGGLEEAEDGGREEMEDLRREEEQEGGREVEEEEEEGGLDEEEEEEEDDGGLCACMEGLYRLALRRDTTQERLVRLLLWGALMEPEQLRDTLSQLSDA